MLLLGLLAVAQANVLGIDFGSEIVKISSVRAGKKFEVVQNEGRRGVYMTFALTAEGRLFGNDAYRLNSSDLIVSVIKQGLGKPVNDPQLDFHLSRSFQSAKIEESDTLGLSYLFSSHSLPVELISSFFFDYFKQLSEYSLETSYKNCTISVPTAYSRSQKLSLMSSLQLSKMNLLGFVYDNSAAALYHSIGRVDDDVDYVLIIYNIGSSYQQVSAYSLWGYNSNWKYISQVQALAHEFSEDFAGNVIDYDIIQIILNETSGNSSEETGERNSSMMRLLKEVRAAKKKLNSSKFIEINIEKFFKEGNLSFNLTREVLKAVINKHKEEIIGPVKRLMDKLKISNEVVAGFELMGGTSRISYIKEIIETTLGVKVTTKIEPEAVAHGAALIAEQRSSLPGKSIELIEVFPCKISAETFHGQFTVFSENSRLNSSVVINISIQDDDHLILKENCRGFESSYNKYTFEHSGRLSLEFYLDPNGLAELSAVLGPENKFTLTDIAVPKQFSLKDFVSKIAEFNLLEYNVMKNTESLRQIESALEIFKAKLEDDQFKKIFTEEQLASYTEYVRGVEAWIESQVFLKMSVDEMKNKVDEVRDMINLPFGKENEYKLMQILMEEASVYFMKLNDFMTHFEKIAHWVSSEELAEVWGDIKSAEQWLAKTKELHDKKSPSDPPVATTSDFDQRFISLSERINKISQYSQNNNTQTPNP